MVENTCISRLSLPVKKYQFYALFWYVYIEIKSLCFNIDQLNKQYDVKDLVKPGTTLMFEVDMFALFLPNKTILSGDT